MRNPGTLVNALLHHMGKRPIFRASAASCARGSCIGWTSRPSGAIVVAKDDVTHRKLGEMFAARRVAKTYIALVHGNLAKDQITVNLPIARDVVRRTRMTTRRADGRSAVSHIKVMERLATRYGAFTLVEVRIETGRTHRYACICSPWGIPLWETRCMARPRLISPKVRNTGMERPTEEKSLRLERNFLHAAHLGFAHPQTGKTIALGAPLPPELEELMAQLRTERVS